ncbi:MAG: hypothetical protein KDB18_08345, partial [Salinibacterium sp.]|nr:hypothetical protein [Salinibacterium sp.]
MAKRGAASPKTKSKSKAQAGAAVSVFQRPGVRAAGFVMIGLAALATLGGAGYGVWTVDARARRSLAALPQQVEIAWPTIVRGSETRHVLDEQVRAEVQSQVEAIINHEPDPFGSESLEQAGEWLASSGWFADAPTVERIDARRVSITGVWRRPVAMVRYGQGDQARDYLVDSELRLLPKVYMQGERTGPYLTGATHSPAGNAPWTPDHRTPWPDQSLVEGLELLMLLV